MKYSHFALFLILSTLCSSIFFNGGSPAAEAAGISSIISRAVFDEMLKHRNDTSCRSEKFYTYEAFVTAAKSFEGFGTTGNLNTRKREIAAFLGQTSKQTAGKQAPTLNYSLVFFFFFTLSHFPYQILNILFFV